MKSVTLYTVQKPGHDITINHRPLEDYRLEGEAYYDIAKYLKWDSWVWTFPEIEDFVNDWLVIEKIAKCDLWTLSVPRDSIRWCALNRQCENVEPIETWFSQDPESIRRAGDIPQGLVKAPINPEWVLVNYADLRFLLMDSTLR